jgi:hypothetical protein
MSVLAIPKTWLYVAAGLALVASHLLAYNAGARHQGTADDLATALTANQAASQALGTVVAKATDNAQRSERRDTLRQEADDESTQRLRVLETDAGRLRAERDSLRIAARAAGERARGACTQGQATESGRQAATALEVVFEQCGGRYEAVAIAADRAIASGLKCEAEHAADETLTGPAPAVTPESGSGQ